MLRKWKRLLLVVGVVLFPAGLAHAQTLSVSSISPTSGPVGSIVTIIGLNFGESQGSSTVSLNGTNSVITSWTDTAITALVPSGGSSGLFSVVVNGESANSSAFTVTALPTGWSDGDVGSVGVGGSASYGLGTFTVKGSGQYINHSSDGMNFAYEPLSGDGTIVARVLSVTGTTTAQVGVMIRETLNAGSTMAFVDYENSSYSEDYFYYRATTGANLLYQGITSGHTPPYWLKLTRSGSTFTGYTSPDGLNWQAAGSSETIAMAQNVYIGLAVSSDNNSTLATATFDQVSITLPGSPAPVISSTSATTGSIGSQVVISGSGFGAPQAGSLILLNDALVTVNSWSATTISITIPTGATSGPLVVSVAPSMNDSNPVNFTLTTQPLPNSWLNQDIGTVGVAGTATYASRAFTVTSSGTGIGNSGDNMHFVYQSLAGDGTIVARVSNVQGTNPTAGVMIRETLNPGATMAFSDYYNRSEAYFYYRTTTGANAGYAPGISGGLPYWLKLVRSGSTFSAYASSDGVNWSQTGSSETINMAQNVYVGLAVTGAVNSGAVTVTFDNVSFSSASNAAPVITGLSSTTASVGGQVSISGSGFGNLQGSSLVTLNGSPVTINSWSATTIVITIPSGATSGPLVVIVAPTMNDSNPVVFTVTSQPLPPGLSDQDVSAPSGGVFGVAGSATYSSNVFTIKGAGPGLGFSATDGMHFVFQPLTGDGTILARITSLQGGNNGAEVGVAIRETLGTSATFASGGYGNHYMYFWDRTSTGSNGAYQSTSNYLSLPYWAKLVRSGSTFSAYQSSDGMNWVQIGSSVTINMAANAYVGLAVASGSNTSLATATFDNVSISSTTSPAPVITSVSATTGLAGSEVSISGSGFGASQGNSLVMLNDAPVTINSWGATSIVITIPSGATSGPLVVSVAPGMNDSNPVDFTVTTQPLPTPWLDQDVGQVGAPGSATYSSGVFTVTAEGLGSGSADKMHFVYQPLSTDATIVARVVSLSGPGGSAAVAMIRETLSPGSTDGYSGYMNTGIYFWDRLTTGANVASQIGGTVTLPYWVKVVRSGSTFAGYRSADGLTWVQVGSSVTISMAQNYDIGLAVLSGSNTVTATATFDNVSVTIGTTPFVTGLSPVLGNISGSVTITGSHFGTTQGTSSVSFNGTAASTINGWADSQIVAVYRQARRLVR